MSFLKFQSFGKKSIAVGLFLSLFLLFPSEAKAQYVDLVQSVKEYVADPLAWAVANKVIEGVTAQTVNWINSGFQGNPAYVTNPGQFFLNVADNQASNFLSSTALNQLCSPFKAQVRLALVRNYLRDNQNFSCTLSKISNNYDQFINDFNQGGWDGWFEMTQNDQSNPYGAYLQTQNALATNIGNAQENYKDQLNWGRGFLSFEKCKSGTE